MNLANINEGIITLVIFLIILIIIGICTLFYYLYNKNETPNVSSNSSSVSSNSSSVSSTSPSLTKSDTKK
jgi:cytoskeletal protein RodZ